jgi:hypothetical protein
MYILNFLFDFPGDGRGHFSGDKGNHPLLRSKNWLKLDGLDPDPFPPQEHAWINLGDVDTHALLLRKKPNPTDPEDRNIGIHIAPAPAHNLRLGPGGARLTVAVSFGRPTMASHPRASPFLDVNGQVRTMFVFSGETNSTTIDQAGNPVPSWFFRLGIVDDAAGSANPNRANRYQFSVGIEVTNVGSPGERMTRYYGQDPEMDVND